MTISVTLFDNNVAFKDAFHLIESLLVHALKTVDDHLKAEKGKALNSCSKKNQKLWGEIFEDTCWEGYG